MKANANSISDSSEMFKSLHQRQLSGSIRSNTNSSNDDIGSKRCQVCKKGFMLRRKITCQICLNVYCSDHCTRKRKLSENEDFAFICDVCDEEETKKEIAQEIDQEIEKLSLEVKELRENNERLFKEHYNNTASLNNIDMEIKKQEWNNKKQEEELLSQLESEQNRGLKIRNQVDSLRRALDESSKAEKYMSEACLEAENETEGLKLEIHNVQEQKDEIISQIDKINSSLRQSLSLDQIRKILCEKCLLLVNKNLESNEKPIEDVVETVKEYHRQSLVSQDTDKPTKECVVC